MGSRQELKFMQHQKKKTSATSASKNDLSSRKIKVLEVNQGEREKEKDLEYGSAHEETDGGGDILSEEIEVEEYVAHQESEDVQTPFPGVLQAQPMNQTTIPSFETQGEVVSLSTCLFNKCYSHCINCIIICLLVIILLFVARLSAS